MEEVCNMSDNDERVNAQLIRFFEKVILN
ncbi:TPA: sigma-70 family RNA polymerase sigma factor, partial [Enterococcus faecium]|nr:sigma-70 family RNA polymerase sigma factor [Enterococcus faecium]